MLNFNIDRQHSYEQLALEITESNKLLNNIISDKKNIDSFEEKIILIEKIFNSLQQKWGLLDHLQNVLNEENLREIHNSTNELFSNFFNEWSLSKDLMSVYQIVSESKNLNEDEKLALSQSLLDFKLAGVLLEDDQKKELMEIQLKLSSLSNKFGENVLDSTDNWKKIVQECDLDGLSDAQKDYLKNLAKEINQDGFLINLSGPCYQLVMTYCSVRDTRKKIYEANAHKASKYDETSSEYDNQAIAEDILKLRKKEALLLGYSSIGEMSLEKRFAKKASEIEDFYNNLITKIQPIAKKEYLDLENFAKQKDALEHLEPWDIAYYSQLLKLEELSLDEEKVREYFKLSKVLTDMFDLFGKLFNFKIKKNTTAPIWHEDVLCFEIIKEDGSCGYLYLDLFARNKKRAGAWMSGAIDKASCNTWRQDPTAYIICNFRKNEHSLLRFDEIETLFHEFGHSLHHLLTKRTIPSIAGINQVPWDIVELPSQLLEQWCYEPSFLKKMSEHFQTKESLPLTIIETLCSSKKFQAGLFFLRQIEFGLFDWEVHENYLSSNTDISEFWKGLRSKFAATPIISTHSFPLSFTHIFDGGYAAGYYSYLWADAYVYQVYQKIQKSTDTQKACEKFMSKFLSLGGSLSLKESLHEFLEEPQSVDPLLLAHGLLA